MAKNLKRAAGAKRLAAKLDKAQKQVRTSPPPLAHQAIEQLRGILAHENLPDQIEKEDAHSHEDACAEREPPVPSERQRIR
jgi:hypothetical protein